MSKKSAWLITNEVQPSEEGIFSVLITLAADPEKRTLLVQREDQGSIIGVIAYRIAEDESTSELARVTARRSEIGFVGYKPAGSPPPLIEFGKIAYKGDCNRDRGLNTVVMACMFVLLDYIIAANPLQINGIGLPRSALPADINGVFSADIAYRLGFEQSTVDANKILHMRLYELRQLLTETIGEFELATQQRLTMQNSQFANSLRILCPKRTLFSVLEIANDHEKPRRHKKKK